MDTDIVRELLTTRPDGRLIHRESKELEFKEQFNFSSLDSYVKDFAAFANNCGGYILFGVKDQPRVLIGLSESSKQHFDEFDPERVTENILDVFSSEISYSIDMIEINGMFFGAIYIHESTNKPIIAKKNAGRDGQIKDGEIYYRYGGRTQKIRYAELEGIILKRIDNQLKNISSLVSRIVTIGPSKAAIFDTENGTIEKNENTVLLLDKSILDKVKFIREGEFNERKGQTTLKVVGDVVPISHTAAQREQQVYLLEKYPLTHTEMKRKVKQIVPNAKDGQINQIIRDNLIKDNPDYSMYNFRSKSHQDKYKETGLCPTGTPSIYNQGAVEYIVSVLTSGDV